MKQTYNTQGAAEEEVRSPIDHTENNSLLDPKTRKDTNIKNRKDPEGKKRIWGMAMEAPDEGGGDAGAGGSSDGGGVGPK